MRVLIVGGGPAGCLTAINLGKKADVKLIESKSRVGFPMKCGGLISKRCYNELKKYGVDAKLNEIKGAFVFSPSGDYVELFGKTSAVVVERKIMDLQLLKEASKTAEVILGAKFAESDNRRAKVFVSGELKFFEFDYLIGADGVESRVASVFNFRRPLIYTALQYLIEFEPIDKNMVEIYFGRKYSNGFFAYSIPICESFARVGVVSKDNPGKYLDNLLKRHPSVSKRVGKSILEINMGGIPLSLVDFVKENIALIGDSAGMVKPYTGGGVYYLLRASELLGEHFPDLIRFKREYLKEFKKEYSIGEKIRKLYQILRDEDYDFLVKISKDVDFSNVDMDRPSTVLKILPKFVRKPKIFFEIMGILKRLKSKDEIS